MIDLHYWRKDRPTLNLGEAFVPEIANYFGLQVGRSSSVLLMIGSELNRRTIRRLKKSYESIVVWGYGYSEGPPPNKELLSVRAVRGYLTRKVLGLDDSCPVGDPGLLLPLAMPIVRKGGGEKRIVPHWFARQFYERDGITDIEIKVPDRQANLRQRLQTIIDSEFVFTSSLHCALACVAYGTPFGLLLHEEESPNKPNKWIDAFSVFDIEPKFHRQQEAAKLWYESIRKKLNYNLAPLIDAFPAEYATSQKV